jgi:hypothetical protein
VLGDPPIEQHHVTDLVFEGERQGGDAEGVETEIFQETMSRLDDVRQLTAPCDADGGDDVFEEGGGRRRRNGGDLHEDPL